MVEKRSPSISTLSNEEKKAYVVGLKMLALTISDDFFDIPKLPSAKYSKDGLFYEIPYFSSEQLWTQDNQRMLVVVYKIEKKSSMCPLRIDFKFEVKEDSVDYWLYVFDQSGERTVKWELVVKENGENYTTIPEHETIKLTELIGYTRKDLR